MHFTATSDVDVFVFPFGVLSFNYNNNIDCYKLVWLSDIFMRILKVPSLVCLCILTNSSSWSSTHYRYTSLLIKIWMRTDHRGNMCKSMQKQVHGKCTYFTSLRTYITNISIYKYISTNVMDFHDSASNTSMQYLRNIISFHSLCFSNLGLKMV